jgi:hypothetical protein
MRQAGGGGDVDEGRGAGCGTLRSGVWPGALPAKEASSSAHVAGWLAALKGPPHG